MTGGGPSYERPIDRYPRLRDAGRWIVYSGITPFAGGCYFVYRAWAGVDPGMSALVAFLLGMAAMAVFVTPDVLESAASNQRNDEN